MAEVVDVEAEDGGGSDAIFGAEVEDELGGRAECVVGVVDVKAAGCDGGGEDVVDGEVEGAGEDGLIEDGGEEGLVGAGTCGF